LLNGVHPDCFHSWNISKTLVCKSRDQLQNLQIRHFGVAVVMESSVKEKGAARPLLRIITLQESLIWPHLRQIHIIY